MDCRMVSFSLQRSLARLTFLIALVALPALGAYAQMRSGADVYQKISLKTSRPCAVGTSGEITALVMNGVELSVTEDWDCDGIPDAYDNCVGMPNAEQIDSDRNGIGDVCEAAVTIKAGVPPTSRSNVRASSKSRSNTKANSRHHKAIKNRTARAADRHSRSSVKRRRRH